MYLNRVMLDSMRLVENDVFIMSMIVMLRKSRRLEVSGDIVKSTATPTYVPAMTTDDLLDMFRKLTEKV
jgi:hypothetical protein